MSVKNEKTKINKTPSTALAPVTESKMSIGGKEYACKHVTMPTTNPGVNEPRVFRIDSAIHASTYVDKTTADGTRAGKAKDPARVCTVTNMETGEIANWLMPTLAYKELEEKYPDESYVGKIFAYQKLPKRPGKTYFDIQLAELIEQDKG